MYHILRIILYRLWVVSTLTLFFGVVVFWFYGFLTALVVFTLGISGILYNAQDLLLYYPNDPPDSRVFVLQPSNYKLPYESIKIINKDGFKIHLFLIKQPVNSNHKPTMIFFHGNAGNMGQRLSNVSGFYHKLNINILMVEYRGYGLSEGSPSERGLYVDAQSALDYIMHRTDIDVSKIMIFGRSLGGAIAIDLASRLEYRNKIWALVVENTFTSIPDMAQVILKWKCLNWLPPCCHKNKYFSLKKMAHVMTPTLVICGSNDALVPPAMAKELYLRCGAVCKKLVVMPGGGHDDTWTCRDYYSSVQQFLVNVPPLPGEIGILYNAQDLLLYYPNDPPDSRVFVLQPSNYKLPYESIKIINKDGFKIHLFLIKQPVNSNHKPTMIFFHGNAGNMGQRLSNVSGFYHKLNINILMVEYRGYGLSEGSPSERGLYVDAQSALDYIMHRTDIDVSKIMIFGRSLGGAIAIDLASRLEYRNKIWALVVENTFTSIPDMAQVILKWKCLNWLPPCCHKNKYFSLKKMAHVMTPTLVICGSNDALVPPAMAKELYLRCGAVCKKLVVMPGGGHDDTWTCRDYYSSVQQFLVNVPPLPGEIGPFFDDDTNSTKRHTIVHTV